MADVTALLPNAQQQFIDSNGVPLAGGFVFTFISGTTTPKMTWQDSAGSVPNTNPIVLDANGQARIWGTGAYRQIVEDSNGTLIWDQITSALGLVDFSAPFPSSFGPYPTDLVDINVGSFPTTGEIPNGIAQALAVKMVVPLGFTGAPWPNTAISAYVKNGNVVAGNSAASYFGVTGITGDGASAYGLNLVVTNGTGLDAISGQGHNFGVVEGIEINPNIYKVGANPPTGDLIGLMFVGSSEVAPASSSYAVQVRNLGTGIPWTTAFQSQDGGASNFAEAGRTGTGNNVGSQAIVFDATDGSGVQRQASVYANPDGGWQVNTGSDAPFIVSIGFNNPHFKVTSGDIQALDGVLRLGNAGGNSPTIDYDSVGKALNLGGVNGSLLLALNDNTLGVGTTTMSLLVNQSGIISIQPVTVGAPDSAGTGFRALRVVN